MITFKIITICLFFLLYVLRITHLIHIFQLNSYKNIVQFKWFFKNRKEFVVFLLLSLGLLSVLFIKSTIICYIITWISYLATIIFSIPKKAKKPLIFTKRVIRLLITTSMLALALNLIYLFIYSFKLQLILQLTFCLLCPIVLLLANLINRPVELGINKYFINDAKKIIKSHNTLITIGVTGSYGKTSVKFMLGTLLESKYNVLVTPESYNTPLGITKTIRNHLRATHDIFVCEMGAKHVGDIKEICDIVNPDYGIITSIGPQHLESFKNINNVINTKFELADSLSLPGRLFLNGEDTNIQSHQHSHPAITYGFSNTNDYYASDISVSPNGTTFIVHHNNKAVEFNTLLLGHHNVLNLLGAIAICCELGIDLGTLPNFARKIQPIEHRLQLYKRNNITIIDDAYNSNPSGVRAAMNVLSLFNGFKIVITPGMIELGKVQEDENYKFGVIMSQICDYVVLVGKKQTESIFKGLTDNGFEESNIFIASNLTEGANKAFSLSTKTLDKIVLFENDLPDNY